MYKSATKVANCFLPNLSVETVIYKHSMLYLQWEAGWKRFADLQKYFRTFASLQITW